MRFFNGSRRGLALLGALVIGGVLAGAVVAAQYGGGGVPGDLQAAIESDPLAQIAEVPAEGPLARRGVYVQPTSAGFLCLWDAPGAESRERRGGCNPADDPYSAGELRASFTYDGGPGIADVRDARVFGLVSSAVTRVHVLMSDGTRRQVALRSISFDGVVYRGFAYRIRPSDLRKSLGPTAVVAVNAAGKEIARQATGFVDEMVARKVARSRGRSRPS